MIRGVIRSRRLLAAVCLQAPDDRLAASHQTTSSRRSNAQLLRVMHVLGLLWQI